MPLTGAPSAGTRHSIWLNSVEYPIVGDIQTVTRPTTSEKTVRLSAWSGGVGAYHFESLGNPRPHMIYDATADTSKPGGITPPLLINTATQAAASSETQTNRIFAVGEINGVLNCFSIGTMTGPVTRLLRFEWDGATTTWTLTDVGVGNVTGVGKNTAIVAGSRVVGFSNATGMSYAYSTNGTSWTGNSTATAGNAEWLSNFGTSATGYALGSDLGLYSFTIGAGFVSVLASVYPSTETVKSFFSWKNTSGVDVLYLLTNKALRQSNATPNAFTILLSMTGADANYALPVGAHLYLAYGSKGGVREYQWDANGGLVSVEGGLDLADGLPSDVVGSVTYLAEAEGYLYALVSAGAANIKNAVYRRRWPFTTENGWHAVYKSATANQASAIIALSSADDSVTRLHIAEKNASTTDYLYYLNMSGTLSYQAGYVTWPEMVFSDVRGASAITEATIYADGLSANETILLAFDKDGAGSFTTFGTFTSSALTLPASPDGGVTMNRGTPKLTWANGTATSKATLRELVFKVLVKTGLLLEHTVIIDLYGAMATSVNTTEDASRTALQALVKTGGLVSFQRDTDIDSTARKVSVQYVGTAIESLARTTGSTELRRDSGNFFTPLGTRYGRRRLGARYAAVTLVEAIGS